MEPFRAKVMNSGAEEEEAKAYTELHVIGGEQLAWYGSMVVLNLQELDKTESKAEAIVAGSLATVAGYRLSEAHPSIAAEDLKDLDAEDLACPRAVALCRWGSLLSGSMKRLPAPS